ncbi:hypothetical protein BM536_035285 [Streptomyces phaeoluteigriseus]|uniref:Uncharacterized protein n=1 Tax=Streptomyces phaeoluteigriseus TaxID=114686 RepID=A0A1V6MIG6_9ACTN|nr:hypothetical protein [Streptomyces phaeoluteigriseus]OQD52259.1 hypothetical protein BM536_035285 [Streptomyces phaeoluteigriseus]
MPDEPTVGRDAAAWSLLDSDGWYAARNATTALRDVLVRAGLEKDFPYLRADLNAFGHGLVELGRVSPDTAERLAELLRLALASGYGRDRDGDGHASTTAEEHKGRT